MKRVVIFWPGFTGYMADCFRALSARCELRVFIEPSGYERGFDGRALDGLVWERVESPDDPATQERVLGTVRDFHPDFALVCGWSTPLCRLMGRTDLGARKILAFDMPWEWRLRKILARWALRPYLRHFDGAFVPGNRCCRYAQWLGFTNRVQTGSNPSGWERFKDVTAQGEGFLFVGRFSSEKGLPILLAAYARYRAQAKAPWRLDLAGTGDALPNELPEGVRVLGFVPPADMPRVMGEHGCLVLPSTWEPWGVCAAEAMCVGLPTVLSKACGLTDDVMPTVAVRTGDVNELVLAMAHVAGMTSRERASESTRVRSLMAHYSCEAWASRVMGMVEGWKLKVEG